MTMTASQRGGALGAMDTTVQCGKIQEGRLYCGYKKHGGSLPLVDVITYPPKEHGGAVATKIELIRSTLEERGAADSRPQGLAGLAQAAGAGIGDESDALIEVKKMHSLGQISHALHDEAGECWRNI